MQLSRAHRTILLLCATALLICSYAEPSDPSDNQLGEADATANTLPATPVGPPAPAAEDRLTAMHILPKPSPKPAVQNNPWQRLALPRTPQRRDLVTETTAPGSLAVMFLQTASTATVSSTTLVLEDVPIDTTWIVNRPDRRTGIVPTGPLLAMLYMPTQERAINAEITYVTDNGRVSRPKSATIMLWDPRYSESTRRLTYKWARLGKGGSDLLLPVGSRKLQLKSVSLFLDSCPSNVPFVCCKGDNCNQNWATILDGNVGGDGTCTISKTPTTSSWFWSDTSNWQQLSCPSNIVGTVTDNACWDTHTKVETYYGSCVACHASHVDELCAQTYPDQCGPGTEGCTSGWYPAYWPYYCHMEDAGAQYSGCFCPGALPVSTTPYYNYCPNVCNPVDWLGSPNC